MGYYFFVLWVSRLIDGRIDVMSDETKPSAWHENTRLRSRIVVCRVACRPRDVTTE
jgi:hypothetical protein